MGRINSYARVTVSFTVEESVPILDHGEWAAGTWDLEVDAYVYPGEKQTWDYPGCGPTYDITDIRVRPEGGEWGKVIDADLLSLWVSDDDVRERIFERADELWAERNLPYED